MHFNGTSVKFKECSEGLYYFDTKNSINKNNDSVTDYPKSIVVSHITLLNTVFDNRQAFRTFFELNTCTIEIHCRSFLNSGIYSDPHST